MKLIVGLGNPGRKYLKTRHNIGFMVIDTLADREKLTLNLKTKFKGEIVQATIKGEDVILLKPNTFMNLSGEAVSAIKQFYQIKSEDMLIIHDDLDLEPGTVRIRQKGSSGGHNGLKSIISCIGDENFHRLKLGIGRDEFIPVTDYVLNKFSKSEFDNISNVIIKSVDIIYDWLEYGILYVMNKYN